MKKNVYIPNYPDIKDIYNKALDEPLILEDISGLTLHVKCKIISGLVGALRNKIPQRKYGSARHTRQSLLMIAQSFTPSDGLINIQNKKREAFFRIMQDSKNSAVLDDIRNWGERSQKEREATIIHTSRLHQRTYLTGIADVLPVNYMFRNGVASHNQLSASKKILGGFSGSLVKRTSCITQNTDDYSNFSDPLDALHTAHHEVTHAIQFSLASAFHYKQIRPDHILYNDARTFHAIEVNNAFISFFVLSSSDNLAYSEQIHETLAEDEGHFISKGLLELADS